MADLERLLEGETRCDPERPLLWTSKSVRKLAVALRELGHEVSYRAVARLLHELGYSLQANRKTKEGRQRPDRDAHFRHINTRVAAALAVREPLISVDTKTKELVGEYKNGGREWRRKGDRVAVEVHDFTDKELGKAIPFGVYDIGANQGFANVGITSETAAFAVAGFRAGGSSSAPSATRAPPACRSPPTAAATAPAPGCGSWSCSGWPTKQGCESRSVTSRPARAS